MRAMEEGLGKHQSAVKGYGNRFLMPSTHSSHLRVFFARDWPSTKNPSTFHCPSKVADFCLCLEPIANRVDGVQLYDFSTVSAPEPPHLDTSLVTLEETEENLTEGQKAGGWTLEQGAGHGNA